MKRISLTKAVTLFLGIIFLAASLIQCTKEANYLKVLDGLDRSFTGTADSTIYASFYESNTITPSDATPDVNDVIKFRSVQTVIYEYCGTSNCHGGAKNALGATIPGKISPTFATYADVMKYVTAGSPENSKLWNYITTNDFNKAMPPVHSNHELNITDKSLIFNWIKNGAKERPDYKDFRPAAIELIITGCGSANCHNQATATGGWARAGLIPGITPANTTQYIYINPLTGAGTNYCQLINKSKLEEVWGVAENPITAPYSYKDSVKLFYSDTVANASFRPWKKFSTPRSALSTRGPLSTYDDILMDIMYPKGIRSSSSVLYTDPVTLKTYYVGSNYLNASPSSPSSLVSRIDSTLLLANPFTGVYATAHQGDMAYGDGGLKPHEVALIKAWYFADPNIPAVWKYGKANEGIFKYRKTGTIIKQ